MFSTQVPIEDRYGDALKLLRRCYQFGIFITMSLENGISKTSESVLSLIAQAGGEEEDDLLETFGSAPLFPLSLDIETRVLTFLFCDTVIQECCLSKHTTVGQRSPSLIRAWLKRIDTWLFRFFPHAYPGETDTLSTSGGLYLTRLFLLARLSSCSSNDGSTTMFSPSLVHLLHSSSSSVPVSTALQRQFFACQSNDDVAVSLLGSYNALRFLFRFMICNPTTCSRPDHDHHEQLSQPSAFWQRCLQTLTRRNQALFVESTHSTQWQTDLEVETKRLQEDQETHPDFVQKNWATMLGSSMEIKQRCLLETSTRAYYWIKIQHNILCEFKQITLPQKPLQVVVSLVRSFLDRVMIREPIDETIDRLPLAVYVHNMPMCTLEAYLQCYPLQTTQTPVVTVMNNMLDPAHIKDMQGHLNETTFRQKYNNDAFPYRDIIDLVAFGGEFETKCQLTFYDRYVVDGFHFPSRQSWIGEERRGTFPRSPLIVCLLGRWCVIHKTDQLIVCQNTLEAIAVWLIIVRTCHRSFMDVGNVNIQTKLIEKVFRSYPTDNFNHWLSCLERNQQQHMTELKGTERHGTNATRFGVSVPTNELPGSQPLSFYQFKLKHSFERF